MLFLTLNIFSSVGGIQTACRTMAFALASIYGDELRVLALHDETSDSRYISAPHFKGYKRNKIRFALEIISNSHRQHTIIISHINLLVFSLLIRIINKKVKIIMLAHGTEICRPIAFWKKWFIKKYVCCWAVSLFTAENLRQRHGITNTLVINNCLDPLFPNPKRFNKSISLLNRYGLSSAQPILLTICRIGRHEQDKGYDKIILLLKQIRKEFPNIHYLLCGQTEHSEGQRLQTLIDQNQLHTHITITGPVSIDELTDHYLLADTFILPSTKEGFGIVFVEAAACGCRLIAGNSDGSRDALLNGETGFLLNPEEPEELYNAIIKQLKRSWSQHDKKNQQELIIKHFGYSQYEAKIRQYLNPY